MAVFERVALAAMLIAIVGSPVAAQERIKPGDIVVVARASVPIYDAPGGTDQGRKLSRQELQLTGAAIIVEEARTVGTQLWYRIRITIGGQEDVHDPVPDTDGWVRAADVRKRVATRESPSGA